jgi:predicted nucleic acid-binding protein
MYFIDTNVISELRKGSKCNLSVQRFFESIQSESIYISVLTLGEIRRGCENIRQRGDTLQASQLENWLEEITREYKNKILSFDDECAQVWGKLMSPHKSNPIDKQIAAIAMINQLAVVTRNVDDFRETGVQMINPFMH